jgi:hypothetical protein
VPTLGGYVPDELAFIIINTVFLCRIRKKRKTGKIT